MFERKKLKWLSHSAIELGKRCPRCFWLKVNKNIRQPEGIQSRLANRFDKVIKEYFNGFRSKGEVPPIVKDKIAGKLQNPFKETYFHRLDDRYGFLGKLDECFVEDGYFVPIDFKTTSSDPAAFDAPGLDPRKSNLLETYRNQIEEYVYLMEKNRLPTKRYGYLVFFYPDLSTEVHNGFPMKTVIRKIMEVDPDKVTERISKAVKILDGEIPESSKDCEFCNWLKEVKNYSKKTSSQKKIEEQALF